MTHVELLLLALIFNYNHWLVHTVASLWHDFLDASINLGWNHDSVLSKEIVFEDVTKYITSCHEIANSDFVVRGPVPALVLVEAWNIDSTGDEHTLGKSGDSLEGSLNTIKNRVQDT